MPKNAYFLRARDLLISPKTTQRHFLFTLHPLSTVIFATATVLAFVLLRNSNFNFHCYTQHEATPTQKSARKWAATSRDFFRERLQSGVSKPNTLANQLLWIAQYRHFEGSSPLYLSASLRIYQPSRSLRSFLEKLVRIPQTNLKTVVSPHGMSESVARVLKTKQFKKYKWK